MTPEQNEEAVARVMAIAVTAAQISAGLAQSLRQIGMLHDKHAEHFAKLSRHLGELLQDAGEDELAGDFGAIAAILRQPPPASVRE